MVRTARERDLALVVRLDMPPDWARRDVDEGLPFNVAAYVDFVTAVVSRYQGHILGYVIWNEPDLAAEWSRSGGDLPSHWRLYDGWVVDPAGYVGVLGVAFRHIRAADAQALVLGGGLAPTKYLAAAFERARDDWPWVEMLTVWNLVYGRDPNDEMSGYSLVNPDLTPRPAYARLQQLNK